MNSLRPSELLHRNLLYARPDGQQLLLDLFLPEPLPRELAGEAKSQADTPAPVVVFFHDGGWRAGSKDICPLRWMTRQGFAVASVNYRLVPYAHFPQQLHDCHAAVRFLRAKASQYHLDPQRMAAAGVSAGAHLACLLALTQGQPQLQGEGAFDEQSSAVSAVVNYYAFTDLLVMQNRRSRRVNGGANAPETRLLGHTVAEDPGRARLASPCCHIPTEVTPATPAFLHLHGENNEVVPLDQTRRFHIALEEAGVVSKLILVRGAGHGGPGLFQHRSIRDRIADFLRRHMPVE